MGYGSNNLIPAGESEIQKLQFTLKPYYLPLTIMPGLSSGPNSCATLARLGPHGAQISYGYNEL